MATPVYMIFMNSADKSWKIVRQEAWNLLETSVYDDIVDTDVETYYHPDDWNEMKEVLRDDELRETDVALYLPPMQIAGESAEFFNMASLTEFVSRHNLTIVEEFTCYS